MAFSAVKKETLIRNACDLAVPLETGTGNMSFGRRRGTYIATSACRITLGTPFVGLGAVTRPLILASTPSWKGTPFPPILSVLKKGRKGRATPQAGHTPKVAVGPYTRTASFLAMRLSLATSDSMPPFGRPTADEIFSFVSRPPDSRTRFANDKKVVSSTCPASTPFTSSARA